MIVSALVALAMALTGCGTPSNTSAAADVACSDVESELAAVNEALDGTLSVVDRKTAEDDKAALEARQAEAECSDVEAPSASPTPSPEASDREVVVDIAGQAMSQLGFDPEQHKVDDQIDQAVAQAVEAGDGVFTDTKLTSPQAAASFIDSGTPESMAVIAEAEAQTGATPEELADPANWVAITTGEPIAWGGNTYWYGGAMTGAETIRHDPSGSVVMVFVPPGQVASGKVTSVFFLRGACGNPQTAPPVPSKGNPAQPPVPTCPDGRPVPPSGLCPKGYRVPDSPSAPAYTAPQPKGQGDGVLPTRPAPPDPAPSNGLPVRDVNPPAVPAQPDSGPGATSTVPPEFVPVAPAPPAPVLPTDPPSSGIVESD